MQIRAKEGTGYIAQWSERLTADQQVPGSNPGVFSFCFLPFSLPTSTSHLHPLESFLEKHLEEPMSFQIAFGRGFGKAFDLWSRALEKLMEGHLEKNEKLLEVASAQLLGKASELGNSLLKRLRIGHWKSL